MSNVLNEEKQLQVRALGRLGRSLRRIEEQTGVRRRETASAYLKAAGISVRGPGGWGRQRPGVPTESSPQASKSKPANEVTTDSGENPPENYHRKGRTQPAAPVPVNRIERPSRLS